MSTAVSFDTTLQGLWDLARNTSAPAGAQKAAAEAALKLQSAPEGEKDIALTVASATLTALQGPQVAVDPSGGSKAGATIDRSPGAAALKLLQSQHPGAVVIAKEGDLERAIDVAAGGFHKEVSGIKAPPGPAGYTYGLTHVWGHDNGTWELRPLKVIVPASGKPPEVHNFDDRAYTEVARSGNNWVVYELTSQAIILYRSLDAARRGPEPRAALMHVIGESDQLALSPPQGEAVINALLARMSTPVEQVIDQFFDRD